MDTATVQTRGTAQQQTATVKRNIEQQPLAKWPLPIAIWYPPTSSTSSATTFGDNGYVVTLEHCYHKQQRPLGIPDAVSRPPAAASPARKCSTNNQLAQAPVPAKHISSDTEVESAGDSCKQRVSYGIQIFVHSRAAAASVPHVISTSPSEMQQHEQQTPQQQQQTPFEADLQESVNALMEEEEQPLAPLSPLSEAEEEQGTGFLVEAKQAASNCPTGRDSDKWGNRVVKNLLYYQTNYILLFLVIYALMIVCNPTKIIIGLIVQALISAKWYILAGALLGRYLFLHLISAVLLTAFTLLLPISVTFIHASLRLRNMKNKLANTIESFGPSTPMSALLDALNVRAEGVIN
ncbi:GL10670 [Drosophila persimilis]|uniref:GL10670 n=1 Tax=Drosophila persimilis TaxID=7234 RepID=B4GAP9_DROPE|nr:GL10670 [Drosophila persimilis]